MKPVVHRQWELNKQVYKYIMFLASGFKHGAYRMLKYLVKEGILHKKES